MYRRILIAIDSSSAAQHALREVIELARLNRASLAIVATVPRLPRFCWVAAIDPKRLLADNERDARKVIDAAVKHLPEEISVITQIRHGELGPQIVAAAEERDAELIVIGSTGRWRFASWLLGDVAAHVHFHSRIPLMVINEPVERQRTTP